MFGPKMANIVEYTFKIGHTTRGFLQDQLSFGGERALFLKKGP